MTKSERKEIEAAMRDSIASLFTKEKLDELMGRISAMPDYDFEQLLAEAKHRFEKNPLKTKDILEAGRAVQSYFGVTPETRADADRPVDFMTKEEADEFWKNICRSKPSDSIFLMGKDDDRLYAVWKDSVKDKGYLPADLFFAESIPLMDCEITVDERDKTPEAEGGKLVPYRIVIFPDYKERIEASPEEPVDVGAVVCSEGIRRMFFPIKVLKGFDYVMTGNIGVHNMPQIRNVGMATISALIAGAYAYMSTWYGIQIALLHPTVREVFSHPREVKVYDPDPNKKKSKRKTRYIKRHVIRKNEIDDALCGGSARQINRRTLVWYVIGHWRHYTSGNKVFVKGYWKGALRELKRNIDDGRDRVVVLPEGGTV